MINSIRSAYQVFRNDGLNSLLFESIKHVYQTVVASRLPRTVGMYNEVEVIAPRVFDSVVPWRQKDQPYYESGLVSAMEDHVDLDDDIVIVGGGIGVTTVRGAKLAPNGNVLVYEGAADLVDRVSQTAEMNNSSDMIKIIHAVVGPEVEVYGDSDGADHISSGEIPDCDVLELDCEGSEIEILENMTIRPRVILVESHGMNGASSEKIKQLLRENSYSIYSETIADKGKAEFCIENDIRAIAAQCNR